MENGWQPTKFSLEGGFPFLDFKNIKKNVKPLQKV